MNIPMVANTVTRSRYYPAALFAILAGALLLRCWPRLVSPQVWAEDGTQVLHGFIRDGWWSFFQPVNGYWQFAGKLVSAVALNISIYHYPLIATALACLFAVLVGMAVALSPTLLRARFLCALAIFLVPIDAEVFGLPLYAFWWAGILLFLLALWDERQTKPAWRIGFLLIGGLSSPVVIMILPVLYYRACLYRAVRIERWLAVLATLVALLQAGFMVAGTSAPHPPAESLLLHVIPKFLGGFLVGNLGAQPAWSWLAALVLAAGAWSWFRLGAARDARWLLLYLLAGAIALSVARVDPAVLSTYGAGPRYFFYPFILIAWILIQLYFASASILHRALVASLFALAIANMLPVSTRFHVDLAWQSHLRSCRLFPAYDIPVELDGKLVLPGWDIELRGAECDELLRRDRLVAMPALTKLPTFPYAARRADWDRHATNAELIETTMAGGDFPPSTQPGYRIIGSHGRASATGEVRLRMRKGDSLLFRSGADKRGQHIQIEGHERQFLESVPAADDWLRLTFANDNLPAEFIVRITDEGASDGQWSAIALP